MIILRLLDNKTNKNINTNIDNWMTEIKRYWTNKMHIFNMSYFHKSYREH